MAESKEQAPQVPAQPVDDPAVAKVPASAVEDAPDPDEDDLDELDDMLDEFSASKTAAPATVPGPASGSSGPGRPLEGSPEGLSPEAAADEFTAQLQKEMASLMGKIDESPEMQHQLDAMMKELSAGAEASAQDSGSKDAAEAVEKAAANMVAPPGAPEDSFQETIRKTMERMQASGEQAGAAAAAGAAGGGGEQDMLEQLLKEMAAGGGAGEGGEEEFSKMLLGMMEQLTNKEILYEPMKDLQKRFPDWMAENKAKTSKDDLERYETQQKLVDEIVGRFDRPGYTDDNTEDREFIVERMQKMQAAGSPPADLVGDMKETQEALGDLDSGCPQQ